MVHLNRITTRSGDDGTTGLGDGSRVPKTHLRIIAMGSVDELNATLGVALAAVRDDASMIVESLRQVQNDLFDVGAELCFPPAENNDAPSSGIPKSYVERLDGLIDEATGQIPPLESFILPGGTSLAAALHLSRTVCRRAERDVLALSASEPVSGPLRTYLNRLSDLLFVYARLANDAGRRDVLWQPRAGDTPYCGDA